MTHEKYIKVLTLAKTFIQKGWCKEYCAKDKDGYEINPVSPKVKAFCAVGAMIKASKKINNNHYNIHDIKQIFAAANKISPTSIGLWNDARKKKETVLKAFDKAIKYCKELNQ